MKRRVILIIALMLGLVSAIFSFKYMQQGDKAQVALEMARVVVAQKDIQPKEKITIEQVMLKEVPREQVHFEAAVSFDEVVGLYARERILTGEQVLKPRLIKGFADYGIVIKIPSGHRAMTIPVDKVAGVAGFVRPGDLVDIVVGFDEVVAGKNLAKVLLEKVLVLASAQELAEDKRNPENVDTITVAVTPDAAQELALALDHGVVRVLLRPIEIAGETQLDAVPTEATVKGLTEKGQSASISALGKNEKTTPDRKQESIFKGADVEVAPKPLAERELQKWPTAAEVGFKSENPVTIIEEQVVEVTAPEAKTHTVEIIRGTERTTVTVEESEEIAPWGN